MLKVLLLIFTQFVDQDRSDFTLQDKIYIKIKTCETI